jgi:hypothetical protein
MIRRHVQQPNFASWPIPQRLKELLINDESWPNYFLTSPEVLADLSELREKIVEVNFFLSPTDTSHFFEFLKKLVESKPRNSSVLAELSEITVDILDKITVQNQLNTEHAHVAICYLELLSLMLEPHYRYLFNRPEISAWTDDFQKISQIPFNSQELLSQFRKTLLLSFQSNAFIRKYPVLIQTIAELAVSIEKNQTDANVFSAMKLLDTLGALEHALKISTLSGRALNRTAINRSVQATRNLLFDQFQPFVEEDFLKYIVYKSYLQQSYKGLPESNLTELCESRDYQALCKSDYVRFQDNYDCPPGRFPNFSIAIKNNNLSTVSLDRACQVMRDAESFVSWMEDLGFVSDYNASEYRLHVAASKKDFLIDKFLYERNDPPVRSYTVKATYFQNDAVPLPTDFLLGKTFTYTVENIVTAHEYIHQLYALFVKIEFDLTTTEGIAELFARGVCPAGIMHDLKHLENDTTIFEFLRHRKYPFYSNALKWLAYLVNEQPELFKTFINSLQNNATERFYEPLDTFIGNASNRQAFVSWSRQQVNTCNEYLRLFPEAHQPPRIYLDLVKQLVNNSSNTSSPQTGHRARHIAKRDLVSSHFKTDLNESGLVVYSKKVKSDAEIGLKVIPLSLSAFMGGVLSANFDHIGENYQEKYPSLPAYIHHGIKPFLFALISSGFNSILFDQDLREDEQFAQLLTSFMLNFMGVVLGQSLTQKIAETIHNKLLSFLVQSLTWTLLWNPSLLTREYTEIMPVVCMQLMQGLFFKAGEETYTLAKRSYQNSSSFWYKNEQSKDQSKEQSADLEVELTKESLNNEKIEQVPRLELLWSPSP